MPKHARVICNDEFQLLQNHVAQMRFNTRNKLILALSHYAGMRVGEIASIRLSDIVYSSQYQPNDDHAKYAALIHAQWVVARLEIPLRKRETKGRHARVVLLNAKARESIIEYVRACEYFGDLRIPICVNKYGDQMDNVALAQEIRRWYMACGLVGCSSHSGRRGYITKRLEAGANIRIVQELVGHRWINTTQSYADALPGSLRKVAEM